MREETGFVTGVTGCARCGEDHDRIRFRALGRPIGDYTHWATCPETGEPIILTTNAPPGGSVPLPGEVTPGSKEHHAALDSAEKEWLSTQEQGVEDVDKLVKYVRCNLSAMGDGPVVECNRERLREVLARLATDPPRDEPRHVRHEDGHPHESHRWTYRVIRHRKVSACAYCWTEIEDDEAVEPCPAPRDEPKERRYPCMGSHETGPCAHPRHDHETDEHVYPARTTDTGDEG